MITRGPESPVAVRCEVCLGRGTAAHVRSISDGSSFIRLEKPWVFWLSIDRGTTIVCSDACAAKVGEMHDSQRQPLPRPGVVAGLTDQELEVAHLGGHLAVAYIRSLREVLGARLNESAHQAAQRIMGDTPDWSPTPRTCWSCGGPLRDGPPGRCPKGCLSEWVRDRVNDEILRLEWSQDQELCLPYAKDGARLARPTNQFRNVAEMMTWLSWVPAYKPDDADEWVKCSVTPTPEGRAALIKAGRVLRDTCHESALDAAQSHEAVLEQRLEKKGGS